MLAVPGIVADVSEEPTELDGLLVDDAAASSPASVIGPLLKYVKIGGIVALLVNARVSDTETAAEQQFAAQVSLVREYARLRPREMITLEPFFQNCSYIVSRVTI